MNAGAVWGYTAHTADAFSRTLPSWNATVKEDSDARVALAIFALGRN
jgi:hypothetical protein